MKSSDNALPVGIDAIPTEHSGSAAAAPADPIAIVSPEGIAAVLWTVAADVLIFRGGTYVAIAVFLACVPAILRIATTGTARPRALALCGGLSTLVIARLVWLGSPITVFSAMVMAVAMAMAARGQFPKVAEGAIWLLRSVFDGAGRLGRYRWTTRAIDRVRTHHRLASFGLPVLAVVVFGSLFVFANPDWLRWSLDRLWRGWSHAAVWLRDFSVWEVPFCIVAAMLGVGLMRPRRPEFMIGGASTLPPVDQTIPSSLYPAYRNTIATLIGLFAVYLAAEFWTLWVRDFPANFYYAGYAHQGAAWLTVALVLATAALSLIFGRSMRTDPRLSTIRSLAWIWSGLNFLLVLAVYNRLSLYVGYNGLTSARIVGYFGVTLVATGFALVVVKIATDRSFWWLVRSQSIALVVTIILYSVTPVDFIAHRYNVARVQRGDLAPSVMLAVKPIDDEGMLALTHLVDHPNEIIRRGVIARLQKRHAELSTERPDHWMDTQMATRLLGLHVAQVDPVAGNDVLANRLQRQMAIKDFREYAMRWY